MTNRQTATTATPNPDHEPDDLDLFLEDELTDPGFAAAYEDAQIRAAVLADLISCRKGKRLSQQAIADGMGTTQSAVSDIEGGDTDPRISTLQRYARALGGKISVAYCEPLVSPQVHVAPWTTYVQEVTAVQLSPMVFEFRVAPDMLHRSSRIGSRVTISNVRLIESTTAIRGDVENPNTVLTVVMTLGTGFRVDGPALGVRVQYDLRTHLKDDPSATIYEIKTAWLSSYEIVGDEPVDPLDAEAFAATSGPFSAHPYQREFVQRISGQMGFTPLVLNVLRPPLEMASDHDREVPLASEEHATPPAPPKRIASKRAPAKKVAAKRAPAAKKASSGTKKAR